MWEERHGPDAIGAPGEGADRTPVAGPTVNSGVLRIQISAAPTARGPPSRRERYRTDLNEAPSKVLDQRPRPASTLTCGPAARQHAGAIGRRTHRPDAIGGPAKVRISHSRAASHSLIALFIRIQFPAARQHACAVGRRTPPNKTLQVPPSKVRISAPVAGVHSLMSCQSAREARGRHRARNATNRPHGVPSKVRIKAPLRRPKNDRLAELPDSKRAPSDQRTPRGGPDLSARLAAPLNHAACYCAAPPNEPAPGTIAPRQSTQSTLARPH